MHTKVHTTAKLKEAAILAFEKLHAHLSHYVQVGMGKAIYGCTTGIWQLGSN